MSTASPDAIRESLRAVQATIDAQNAALRAAYEELSARVGRDTEVQVSVGALELIAEQAEPRINQPMPQGIRC